MDASWVFDVSIILMLIIFSGFFSGSETALTAVSRARIYAQMTAGNKRAKTVSKLREMKEELIGTILLGNNLVNITATALATSLAIKLFGDDGVFIATIILTLLVLIFAEILPKTFAIRNAEGVALVAAPVIAILVKILLPITRSVNWFIRNLLKIFGVNMLGGEGIGEASEVIRGTIELHHKEGSMVKHDRDMLGSILDLDTIEVGDILIHRKQIEMIDADLDADIIIKQALHSRHSRLPFWQGNSDEIIGLLHVKDLMKLIAELGVKGVDKDMILGLLSKPWFIPETTTLKEQLMAFREQERHFAHVIDEYGDFQGIITLEDIIEEIVGEIRDEHDPTEEQPIMESKNGGYIISGDMTLRDINRELDWQLPDNNAVTLAGLVMHESRSIPEKGAKFSFFGYTFEIVEKRSNQLISIYVTGKSF